MTFTFNDRTALVTGAGRGIGKAIAKKFGSAGMTVICVSKSGTCEETAKEIENSGGKARAIKVDVADAQAVMEKASFLLRQYEKIDILVNNAGITRDGLALRMSLEDWNSVIDTNLSSAFYWTKALLRSMTSSRWGRIINVSSVSGIIGNAGQVNYGAAKAGLHGFTKSLAREIAARNITVNVIAPGFIETDMTSGLCDKVVDAVKQNVPLKRFGKPEEVADLALFLASEQAAYITGQIFAIDGGMAM